jgi:hypothetical protein
MDPYGFDPSMDFTFREMERMNRLTDELDRIDRMVNPLKYKAAELNVIENMAAKLDPIAHMGQKLEPAAHLISEMEQFERIKRDLEPITAQSLIAAQDAFSALSEQIKATITPPASSLTLPDIMPPPDLTPPQITPKDPMQWINDLRIPVPRIDIDLPKLHFPKGRALTDLQQMSDEEIEVFLDDNPSPIAVLKALHELNKRHLDRVTRPHWSVIWTFWLVVASFIVAFVGIILMLLK